MKKIMALVLTGILAAGMLVSCGKFTCSICGEEKSGKKYEEESFGVKVTICKDCHDAAEEALSGLAGLLG